MRLASVQEVRELQLNLLQKFDSYCKENNIQYFAFAGTLLGAVRHGGFIPWDNDIDLAVKRKDYDRLINLLKDEGANPDFRFLCYENDNQYLWQHGRICDRNTYMKTAGGYKKLGLSIDIFPLDNQGNSLRKAKRNLKKTHKCVEYRIMAYDKEYKEMHYPKVGILKKIKMMIEFNIFSHSSQEYWVKKNIILAKRFNNMNSSYYYGCNSNDKYTVVCEKSDFSKSKLLKFENTTIPVPNGYHNILTKYYGDYWVPPKENNRRGVKEMKIYIID